MKIELTEQQFKDSYDWEHIFQTYTTPNWVLPERSREPVPAYGMGDIRDILGLVEGENDGATWVGVFKMNDGNFIVVRAGCDYTGWGCQEGGSSDVATNLTDLVQWGLGKDERERLGA